MRERAKVMLKISDLMEGLAAEEDRQAVAFEVWRCWGGPAFATFASRRERARVKKAEQRAASRQTELDVPESVPKTVQKTVPTPESGDMCGTPHSSTTPVVLSSRIGVHELLGDYEQLFLHLYGEKPRIARGKDAGILADILRRRGPARTRELLAAFFAMDDDFVRRAGHTIGVLATVENRLIAAKNGAAGPALSARTRGSLAGARAFLEQP